MRRCVEKLLLVLLIIIEIRSPKITAAAITMPKSECRRPKERQMPEISGRARHSCACHRFGGQGTARPTYAAWRCRGGCVNRLGGLGARRDEHRYTDWGARARPRALPRKIGLTALCDP